MKINMLVGIVAAMASFGTITNASAQQKPEDVIKYRKSLMGVQSWSMRPIGAMVKGQMPYDKDLVARNAAMLDMTGKMMLEGFAAGSDKGADTKAKPEVWSDGAKFKSANEAFQAEAAKLADVAKTGDFDKIKVQFGATAKACSNCHDNFRNK